MQFGIVAKRIEQNFLIFHFIYQIFLFCLFPKEKLPRPRYFVLLVFGKEK